MKLISAALFFVWQSVSAENIFDCVYSTENWPEPFGELYTCTPYFSSESGPLTGVSGDHQPGKSNQDVKVVSISGQALHRIPKNIDKFFQNLEGLSVSHCYLKFFKDDLKDFPKLRFLLANFNVNDEGINGDLLKALTQLEHVNFDYNEIANVGPGLLSHSPKLAFASFQGNLCIDSKTNTSYTVADIGRELSFKCPPSVDLIEEIIFDGKKFESAVKGMLEPNITVINNDLAKIENATALLNKTVTTVVDQAKQLKEKNETFTNILEILLDDSNECEAEAEARTIEKRVESLENDRGDIQDVENKIPQLDNIFKDFESKIQILENFISNLCTLNNICL